jgi:hypothetical protein
VATLAPTRAFAAQTNLWDLAKKAENTHRFSTLFTAQDVRDRLSSEEGLSSAVDWCRQTGVTKGYLEEFRDGYQADRGTLIRARDLLRQAGLIVSGCITPTGVGKPSTGYKTVSCYTHPATQAEVQKYFEFAASLFDEIMIDDFWFTDCTCPDCDAARRSRTALVGSKTYPAAGDAWEDYRGELMLRVSQERVLSPARKVNPNVRIIIKYPQWYDNFHVRGYDVLRETAEFDLIWVGTESRDYNDSRWGGTVQYESYFIMRWLGRIGGAKCGGGWYDWLGTTERTYVEQARQTILGGARESMLFCYGGLQGSTGPNDVQALRVHLPELLTTAGQVAKRQAVGIAAYKPANSHPEKEARVFDFVGMLGIPLAPCHLFPTNAPAALFSVHALKDPNLQTELAVFVSTGRPVLITDGLAQRLEGKVDLAKPNVQVLKVAGNPKPLLKMEAGALSAIRAPLLRPFHVTLDAPNKVALYLFDDGSWVLENFRDDAVTVQQNGTAISIPARGWVTHWQ